MRQVENLARKSTDKISFTIECRVRAIEFAERTWKDQLITYV